MTSQWESKKLRDLDISFFKGLSIKEKGLEGDAILISSAAVFPAGIKYERTKKFFSKKHKIIEKVLHEGDFLLNCGGVGTLGRSSIYRKNTLNEKAVPDSFVLVIRSNNSDVINDYIFYFFQTTFAEKLIIENTRGTTGITSIRTDSILDFKLPVPSILEQQRIISVLDKAFMDIATAKANTEKNLQNARALLETHFQSVLSRHGDNWTMEKLNNLTNLARGHNPPKSKFSREKKPGYVRFYQIRDGATDDYAVYVPDSPQLHKMKKDDIMMVAYRHVGRAFRGVEGAFNVALCKISNARRDLLEDDFLFSLIPSEFVKGELLKRSERSLIPSMSIEHLREIRIPLPPIHEQKKIIKTSRSLAEETQRLESIYERKLAALGALKKSLLHQAFTGELTKAAA